MESSSRNIGLTSIKISLCVFLTLVRHSSAIFTVDLRVFNSSGSEIDGDIAAYSDFGDLPPVDFEGTLIVAKPLTACQPIKHAPENSSVYFALIERSPGNKNNGTNCTFAEKVLTAQNYGYRGVIVFNDRGNDEDILSMQGGKPWSHQVKIPSVFISKPFGRRLRTLMEKQRISAILPGVSLFEIPKALLIVFALLMGALCGGVCVFLGVRVYRRVYQHYYEGRMSRRALKRIPTKKFRTDDLFETCAICLDDFVEGETIRILPCQHAYHKKCIDPWLLKSRKVCPICKRRVIPRSQDVEMDSSDEEGGEGEGASAASERTPLLGEASGTSRYATTSRPGSSWPHAAYANDSSSDTDLEPALSSVEVHSEPAARPTSQWQRPRRVGAVNSRYIQVDETSDDSDFSTPNATPGLSVDVLSKAQAPTGPSEHPNTEATTTLIPEREDSQTRNDVNTLLPSDNPTASHDKNTPVQAPAQASARVNPFDDITEDAAASASQNQPQMISRDSSLAAENDSTTDEDSVPSVHVVQPSSSGRKKGRKGRK